MRTFQFTFWVAEYDREFEDVCEAVYEAGGSDMLVGIRSGMPYLAVHRDADSLEAAIQSARVTAESAGLQVLRCEMTTEDMAAFAVA